MDAAKLQEIRNAEQQAARIAASIDEEVQALIRNARTKAQKDMDEAKASARKNEESLLAQFQQQGRAQAVKILSSLDADLNKIVHHAEAGEKRAVEMILSEMKVFHGNR